MLPISRTPDPAVLIGLRVDPGPTLIVFQVEVPIPHAKVSCGPCCGLAAWIASLCSKTANTCLLAGRLTFSSLRRWPILKRLHPGSCNNDENIVTRHQTSIVAKELDRKLIAELHWLCFGCNASPYMLHCLQCYSIISKGA